MKNFTSTNKSFYYTQNPDYFDLMIGVYRSVKLYYSPKMMRNYSFPKSFCNSIKDNFDMPFYDLLEMLLIGILFIIGRFKIQYFICKVSLTQNVKYLLVK